MGGKPTRNRQRNATIPRGIVLVRRVLTPLPNFFIVHIAVQQLLKARRLNFSKCCIIWDNQTQNAGASLAAVRCGVRTNELSAGARQYERASGTGFAHAPTGGGGSRDALPHVAKTLCGATQRTQNRQSLHAKPASHTVRAHLQDADIACDDCRVAGTEGRTLA